MTNDPELKAMSEVYDALNGLDATTRKRVLDWVMSKMERGTSSSSTVASKRGPKPGKKRGPKAGAAKKAGKRGRPATKSAEATSTGAKRGPKPGKKRAAKKAGTAKKAGKRGRPAGSANKSAAKKAPAKSTGGRRGRPRKNAATTPGTGTAA